MNPKKLINIILILVILQITRIGYKKLVFIFLNRTLMTDVIVNIIFMITTPIITKSTTLYNIIFLFYGAFVTVIYEEIIFRGYVYKKIADIKNEKIAYLISTLLFEIWHFGYVDTVLWRTSMFVPNANVLNIMFWKVITGLVIGIVLGFFRYKNKNTYSSMLVHATINTFGS